MKLKLQLDIDLLKKLYSEGFSCQKIADRLKCSESYVNHALRDAGYTKRTLSISHQKQQFNHSFFEKIDTEEKAYWLGFLYADGCIRQQKHQFIVRISLAEIEPLEKFIVSLNGSNISIGRYRTSSEFKINTEYFVLTLTSTKMFNDLSNKGCIPRKSLVLTWPDLLPEKLVSHFIRGYFDGDGSISVSTRLGKRRKAKRCAISICGTFEFLSGLQSNCPIFRNSTTLPYKEARKVSNTWSLRMSGGKQTEAFYYYLYQDATVYLSRKKEKYEEFIQQRRSETIISSPTI